MPNAQVTHCNRLLLFAAGATHAAGWSAPLTIDRSFTENSDLIVIYTLEARRVHAGCLAELMDFRREHGHTPRRALGPRSSRRSGHGTEGPTVVHGSVRDWSYHEASSIMLHKP